MAAEVFAPAKINLTLHVTGQRADGYHLLDSLVVFADVGDQIRINSASETSLKVVGPAARGVPKDAENLVLKAARSMVGNRGAALTLHKVLPVASGMGGGTSDAAATLRALSAMWGVSVPDTDALMKLGADLPVCMFAQPARLSGIGDVVSAIMVPRIHMVLVSPNVPISTAQVFKALQNKDNTAMQAELPKWWDALDFCRWLGVQRNDLEPAARAIVPDIGEVLGQISATSGCLLARMSGSGATCFGLFASAAEAEAAAVRIGEARADWWVASAGLWQHA